VIKLKDLISEMKPLNTKEIEALEKKLDEPIKRSGKHGIVVPPKFTEREKYHIINVMLKKERDKNKKEIMKWIAKDPKKDIPSYSGFHKKSTPYQRSRRNK